METAIPIVAGLALLALGGEALIRGAVGVARRLGLSELLIGLTLVGFGTSAPELVTSVDAALRDSPGIALGNVLGSNISNILLILALVVLIRPIAVEPGAARRDGLLVIGASVGLAALALNFGAFDRTTGASLLLCLVAYVVLVWRLERKGGAAADLHQQEAHGHDPTPHGLWISAGLAFGGLALVIWGADLLVAGAIDLARIAGVSETVIGLTIVALGTSLPELVATLAAALKGRADMAFGNIVGSTLYNTLGIVGVTALVQPFTVPADIGFIDWMTLIGSTLLLAVFARPGHRITRLEGALLLTGYALYISYVLSAGANPF